MTLPKSLPKYIDIAFLSLLLPAMVVLLPIESWIHRDPLFVCVLSLWLYAVYLLNRMLAVPNIFRKKRIYITVMVTVICVCGTWALTSYRLDPPSFAEPPAHSRPVPPRIHPRSGQHRPVEGNEFKQRPPRPKVRMQKQGIWLLFLFVCAFSYVVGILTELVKETSRRKSMEIEKQHAELSLLKARIDPHFLFNCLNTLFGMVVMKSAKTEEAFSHFIGMMRYMQSDMAKDTVLLRTEAEYLSRFIQFQKYRLRPGSNVDFEYSHDKTEEMHIAPMILTTFLENVYKHGMSGDSGVRASVILRAYSGKVDLTTVNPVILGSGSSESTGTGIENCRKRLQLLYPGHHSLEITDDGKTWTVRLSIIL